MYLTINKCEHKTRDKTTATRQEIQHLDYYFILFTDGMGDGDCEGLEPLTAAVAARPRPEPLGRPRFRPVPPRAIGDAGSIPRPVGGPGLLEPGS